VNTRQKKAVTSPILLRSASVRLKSALKNFIIAYINESKRPSSRANVFVPTWTILGFSFSSAIFHHL